MPEKNNITIKRRLWKRTIEINTEYKGIGDSDCSFSGTRDRRRSSNPVSTSEIFSYFILTINNYKIRKNPIHFHQNGPTPAFHEWWCPIFFYTIVYSCIMISWTSRRSIFRLFAFSENENLHTFAQKNKKRIGES